MRRGNFFRRNVFAAFVVLGVLFAAGVGATVKLYTVSAEDYPSEVESMDISKQRALEKAVKKAKKEAGVYLKTYSRSVNSELTDDEISAVTSNIIEVFDVHIDKKIIPLSERQTTILYTATLKAKIDPDGIYDYITRDKKEKVTIIQQNNSLQDAIQKNDELTEKLTEQYNNATSQAEKDRIRRQLNDTDRDFLANQKLEEGKKLFYAGDREGAIKLCNEVIELKPNLEVAYNNRGRVYYALGQKERAIQDFNKAIELNPNHEPAYYNRGWAYSELGQKERAFQDFDKAIELNSNYDKAYYNRGDAYSALGQKERAFQDFDKAIELNPNNSYAYFFRGLAYFVLEQYELAIQDFNKAIELNPNDYLAYCVL